MRKAASDPAGARRRGSQAFEFWRLAREAKLPRRTTLEARFGHGPSRSASLFYGVRANETGTLEPGSKFRADLWRSPENCPGSSGHASAAVLHCCDRLGASDRPTRIQVLSRSTTLNEVKVISSWRFRPPACSSSMSRRAASLPMP